jgi:hypothetical protein
MEKREVEGLRARINLLGAPLHQIQGQNLFLRKWSFFRVLRSKPKKWRENRGEEWWVWLHL